MKQLFLSGKGQVEVFDVPIPGRLRDSILVRNTCSLISAGTEGAAVTRHKGLLGLYEKATQSKERVQQVWRVAQTQGVVATMQIVKNKLQDFTPLGYSCAGEVVEIDHDHMPFRKGQLVACMGAGFANHAEYVVVPKNLAVVVPEGVSVDEASFGAIACIAMQGIRRLELAPGERVAVVGLGLIGQLAVRLLNAMGYQTFGTDLNEQRVAKAAEVPGVIAWSSQSTESLSRAMELTSGQGFDGVLLCAATSSDEPVNLAFDLCRQRGRVSVVGDVGLGLRREKMYRKELELRLSASYGPGRYDDNYELRGQDYPLGHVRWTERRNLEYFLHLLQTKRLDLSPLLSARFPVERADEAYAHVKRGDSGTFGVLLEYSAASVALDIQVGRTIRRELPVAVQSVDSHRRIRIGLIGAGGYAKGVHVPNLKKLSDLFDIRGVASRSGGSAGVVARQTGSAVSTSDYRELLADSTIDAVLIATRHASHARLTIDALKAGKHVFVEKPMTTTIEDAQDIIEAAREAGRVVRVGFNRRFSPYMTAMKDAIGREGIRTLTCRVNVGGLSNDWSNTPEEGGRLLGECVHFFDLCNWFMGSEPKSVNAYVAGPVDSLNPNASVLLRYPDGSTAQVLYTALGHRAMGKEYFEAFGNGRAVRVDDFHTIEAFGVSAKVGWKERGDKGQLHALTEFARAVQGKSGDGADARAGLVATWVALAAYESARAESSLPLSV